MLLPHSLLQRSRLEGGGEASPATSVSVESGKGGSGSRGGPVPVAELPEEEVTGVGDREEEDLGVINPPGHLGGQLES